jgi:hypothetical protein
LCKSATGQETGKALTYGGVRAIWIDVKHLARTIDNYPKFNHFVYAKDAVDVREVPRLCDVRPGSGTRAVSVEVREVCDRNWDVCHYTVAHGNAFYLARAIAFPATAKHAADIRSGFFDGEAKRFSAVGVNEGVWRSGID